MGSTRFPISFSVLQIWFFGLCLLLSAPLFVVMGEGWPSLGQCVLSVWAIGILTAVGSLACLRLYDVEASDSQLEGITFWGLRLALRWEEIERVRPINLGGLRFLRLYSQRAAPIWLPLFLIRARAFITFVRARTAEGHPLRAYFEEQET